GNEVAMSLITSGREAEGFSLLDEIIAARPKDYQGYVTKGVELMARERDQEALQVLSAGLKQSDSEFHAPILLNLATLLATSKDDKVRNLPGAEKLANQLVREHESTALHLFCLGDIQGHAGKSQQAVETLNKAIDASIEAGDPETEARARARIAELERLQG
ncbi:MAG TPA: hypothetical protein PKA27_17365, partial [Fimbriimonadaceae bacterium]|nr:hypothetical protein [Fimbriimonadaceae bacterium]